MTQPDKLSLEELQKIAKTMESGCYLRRGLCDESVSFDVRQIVAQLADTMRENERLKAELEAKNAPPYNPYEGDVITVTSGTGTGAVAKVKIIDGAITNLFTGEVVYPNKDSDNG